MNVPPSSAASVSPAAASPIRSDAAEAGGPGTFAEVLGQQLERAAPGDAPDVPTAARPARSAARKPHEASERELQQVDALPLVAAAIESRSLAHPRGEAGAASAGTAASPLAAPAAPHDGRGVMRAISTTAAPQFAAGAPADPRSDAPSDAPPLRSPRAAHDAARQLTASASPGDSGPAGAGHGATLASGPAAAARAPIAIKSATSPAPPGGQDASAKLRAASEGAPPAAPRGKDDEAVRALARDAGPGHEPVRGSGHDELQSPTAPAAMPATAAAHAAAAAAVPTSFASTAAAPAAGAVAPPVASEAWGPALGQEVARLHRAGHGEAQLELNPPGLGPLSVSLSIADQQAHAVFVSPHPAVRAALEAALPQLRNALAENGISLGQASVGAEHQSGSGAFSQAAQDHASQRRQPRASFAAPQVPATPSVAPRRAGGHVLDTFA